jgi:hypothetical protein
VRQEGLGTFEKIYLIGKRSRDLPACSIAPQPLRYPCFKHIVILTHYPSQGRISSLKEVKNCKARRNSDEDLLTKLYEGVADYVIRGDTHSVSKISVFLALLVPWTIPSADVLESGDNVLVAASVPVLR